MHTAAIEAMRGRYRQLKRKRKETIDNNAQIFIVGKKRQRNLRQSVVE
jgi:hypothetical protein